MSNVPLAQNPYKQQQSSGNTINKCRVELLQSPRKNKAVVSVLAKEVGLHLQNEYEKQTHGNTISEELKAEIETFYTRSDISYMMPRAKDEIVIWGSAGKKRRECKYYLTMYLRKAYDVFKETVADGKCHSFSAFCKLRPSNVLLLNDTPKEQCKCQIHESFFMRLEPMGYSYGNGGNVFCDVSENSKWWLSECQSCRNGKKLVPTKPCNFETVYKQWEYVYITYQVIRWKKGLRRMRNHLRNLINSFK